jgi:hypothetical protein
VIKKNGYHYGLFFSQNFSVRDRKDANQLALVGLDSLNIKGLDAMLWHALGKLRLLELEGSIYGR